METTIPHLSVGEVASRTGVTVRQLHHYDATGLLVPSRRSAAGHRAYGDEDLDRLHRILTYRALGLPLGRIAALLDDPATPAERLLRDQRAFVAQRVERLNAVLTAIDKEIEQMRSEIRLTPEERFEVFGDLPESGALDEWGAEAEERWGTTESFQESRRRTAGYTKEDWMAIRAESDANLARFAAALRAGTPAGDPEVIALAAEHRAHIDRWFYPCSVELQVGLARMYVEDPRFTATYDRVAPGLARYVHDAVVAAAGRA